MNIIKHGNCSKEELKPEEFRCEQCGCEFSADYDEYHIHKGSQFLSPSTNTYVYSCKVTDNYVCSCPECHKIVVKEKERTVETPCITTYAGINTATNG